MLFRLGLKKDVEIKVGRMERIWWLERGSGRCQNSRKPLKTRGKRKPVCPENHSGETGCLFQNGGDVIQIRVLLFQPVFDLCRAAVRALPDTAPEKLLVVFQLPVTTSHTGEMILDLLAVHLKVLAHRFAIKTGAAADLIDTQPFFEKILNFIVHG